MNIAMKASPTMTTEPYRAPDARPSARLAVPRALIPAAAIFLTACGFDPSSAEYDERRYKELQKADCREVASLGAKRFISGKSGETYESILERCQKMQAMSFEDYRSAAEQARSTGVWTFDPEEAPGANNP